MSEYIKFGEWVTVAVNKPDALNPRRQPEVRINWSCLGEQPIAVVRKFYNSLAEALEYARLEEVNLFGIQYEN